MSYVLTLLSGIMTGLSMPGNLFSFMIWGSLVFYLKAMASSQKTLQRFLHTFIFSFSMLFTTFWWEIPVLSKNIPQVLGKYPAILGFFGFLGMILLMCLPYFLIWLFSELYHRKSRRFNYWSLVLFYSFSYTAAEALREFGDLAFTGGALGYALYDHTGLLQIASVFGYLGLSFLIVFVNSLIAFEKPKEALTKMLLIICTVYGLNFAIERFVPLPQHTQSIKVDAIQMNVPQEVKYGSNSWTNYFMFQDLIKSSADSGSDVIVLPESAFMSDISDSEIATALSADIAFTKKDVIMGYPRMSQDKDYNTVWHYDSSGNIKEYYDKVKLTPFAEFLPYEVIFGKAQVFKLLRFYTAGNTYSVFDINGKKIGAQICFETYFPEVSMNQSLKGAQALIVITNDGWFGTHTALMQHFSQIIFRAVENRKEVLQVANTGITGKVDSCGRIIKTLNPSQVSKVQFELNLNEKKTFFQSFALLLKILLFIICLVLAIV